MAASNRTFSRQRPAFSYLKHRHRLRESASALCWRNCSWRMEVPPVPMTHGLALSTPTGSTPQTGSRGRAHDWRGHDQRHHGPNYSGHQGQGCDGNHAGRWRRHGFIDEQRWPDHQGWRIAQQHRWFRHFHLHSGKQSNRYRHERDAAGSGVAIHSDSMLIGATDASRQGNGNLSVLNGASVGVGSLTIGSNTSAPSRIKIEGPGSQLSVDHALNLGGSAAHPSSSSTTSVIDIGKGGSLSNAVPPTSSLRPVTSLHDAVLTVAGENSVATLTSWRDRHTSQIGIQCA